MTPIFYPMPIYLSGSSSSGASNWILNGPLLMVTDGLLVMGIIVLIGFVFKDDENLLKVGLALLLLTLLFLILAVTFGHSAGK